MSLLEMHTTVNYHTGHGTSLSWQLGEAAGGFQTSGYHSIMVLPLSWGQGEKARV